MSEKLIKNCRTSRKDRAILALLEHPTLEKAAEAVEEVSQTWRNQR